MNLSTGDPSYDALIIQNLVEMVVLCGTCVILPAVIVWLKMRNKTNETNRRTEVLLAALEKSANMDTEAITKMMTEDEKPASIKSSLLRKMTTGLICSFVGIVLIVLYYALHSVMGLLMGGAVTLAIGLAFILSYLIGMKILAKEIETEEMRLTGSATEFDAE